MKDNLKEKFSKLNKQKLIFTSLIIIIVMYRIFFGTGMGLLEKREQISEANKIERYDEGKQEDFSKKENNANIVEEKNIEKNKKIVVYISGAVANPGVIKIEANKRLDDAIKKLGGLSKDADLERINLAMILEDSQHYIIPRRGEEILEANVVKGEAKDSLEAAGQTANSKDAGKININTAQSDQLETIPGVGPATAKKIIDYRDKEGKFSSVEDIKNVSGIGEKKYENMKDYISVQ